MRIYDVSKMKITVFPELLRLSFKDSLANDGDEGPFIKNLRGV